MGHSLDSAERRATGNFGKAHTLAHKLNSEANQGSKTLLEKNFLGHLKGLQALIKESILDASEADQTSIEQRDYASKDSRQKKQRS